MRRFFLVLLFFGAIGLSAAETVRAETRYISDHLIVSVRSVPSDQYTSVDSLPSDAPVEVLGQEGRFVHVRTEEGVEGYIPEQYLTDETPKPIVINRLESQLAQYERRVETLTEQLHEEKGDLVTTLQDEQARADELQQELADTRQRLESVQQELANTRQSYEQLQENAENVVEITRERDRLDARVDELLQDIEVLEKENDTLLRTGVVKWFAAGGGVFFVGWLTGKVSRKKTRGFG